MTNIFITGATDGIGRETAKQLAARGHNLLVHGRSASKLDELVAELERIPGHGKLAPLCTDLADLDQVRALAWDLEAKHPQLDVLLNNAGVYMNEFVRSAQGHELTWAVNLLAPMLLSLLLLPILRARPDGRIINVSSVAHMRGSGDFAEVDLQRSFTPYAAYARSKLALTLLTSELGRRVGERPLVVSLHPGVVSTKLLTEGFGVQGSESLAEGAATSVYLATAPRSELVAQQGGYFVRSQPANKHPLTRDPDAGALLLEDVCARLGLPLPHSAPSA